MKRFGPLVDAGWLHEHVDDHGVKVIDFRWYLKGRNGRDEYVRGRIPGAVFVNLEDVTGQEGGGRHPLPSAVQFQEPMRDVGLGPETKVVVYDDCGGAVAARLWFLLGYFWPRRAGGTRRWAPGLGRAADDRYATLKAWFVSRSTTGRWCRARLRRRAAAERRAAHRCTRRRAIPR